MLLTAPVLSLSRQLTEDLLDSYRYIICSKINNINLYSLKKFSFNPSPSVISGAPEYDLFNIFLNFVSPIAIIIICTK